MKQRNFLFSLIILLIVFVVLFWRGKGIFLPSSKPSLPSPSPTPKVKGLATVYFNEEEFAYLLVKSTTSLDLISNFSEQKTTEEIMKEGRCKNLVNAGFYQKDFSPLGLLIINGELIKKEIQSATFNGFFAIDSEGWPTLGLKPPSVPLKYALQAGPLLVLNRQPFELKIANDEDARRIIVALGPDNQIIFVAVYNKNSVFSGPKLADLPGLLQEVGRLENMSFVSALNLDGGSASSFWGDNVTLKELSPIGSYFCLN